MRSRDNALGSGLPATEVRRRLGASPALSATPLVSIVVVNRNGAHHLRRLLAGLETRTNYPRIELILVDNASSDGSVELAQAAATGFEVSILANRRNESFSDACNQGAEIAGGELLLFLNNDTEPFEPGWLHELVACAQSPGVGIANPTLIQPRAGSPATYMVQHRAMRLREEDGLLRADLHGRGDDPLGAGLGVDADTPIAAGACVLIERELFRRVGGFTPGFTYGDEDVDLGLKVLDQGRRVVCSGRSLLIHRLGSTRATENSEELRARQQVNRRLLWERWGPRLRRAYELDRIAGGGFWTAPEEDAVRPPSHEEAEMLGFCLKASASAPKPSNDPLERLRDELTRRGHRCIVLRGEEIDDLAAFDHDVAIHLLGKAAYTPRPSQLNVLWAPGSADTAAQTERDRYDLVTTVGEAGQLVDAVLARAEQLAFPTRIGGGSQPASASRSNCSSSPVSRRCLTTRWSPSS